MARLIPLFHAAVVLTALIVLPLDACHAQVSENLLRNPSFEEGAAQNGIPLGWALYGGLDDNRRVSLVEDAHDGEWAVLIHDDDPGQEVGITQSLPVLPDLVYEASVMVRGVEGESTAGSYMQLRFLPSNHFVQVPLRTPHHDVWNRVAVRGVAPPDTERATLYLYTHRDPIPKVMVDSVSLVSGVDPPPPPPPEPVPPVYDRLKDLHLTTTLVTDGRADCTIIVPASGVYDELAARIQAAVEERTGVRPPIADDASEAAEIPFAGNLIILGNRNTSATIGALYDLHYCILDLKYPGSGGYNVRTLHNAFGNGHNAVLVGASDLAGMDAATVAFLRRLSEAEGGAGELSLGRLADISLGEDVDLPDRDDIRAFEIWDASRGYRSTGYFGWNMISKRMAMYYMTGDEFHAREALRLAFPDEQARREITEIEGEMTENKDDPIAGPYHYNAHMMILLWDLIEESPVFTDEERLAVTNAFSRQLDHRKGEGIYGLTQPPGAVGSRHGQWSAVSLYCLGRYFQKYYPNPIWDQCVRGAELHFAPLHEHTWITGEADNLFWYPTGHAPVMLHMILTGDREILESGSLDELLRGQEILASGLVPDWSLNSGALTFFTHAAYLTGDGRWLTYLDRTGVDTNVFRLGWSWWPDESLEPALPVDLVDKWSVHPLPEPLWARRGTGFPFDESFYFASFRSAADASGDFLLLDGFNGASRNPYHAFALLEMRLGGHTLIKHAYRNQVLTRADGMVEPQVAMDAALRRRDVLGGTAVAVAEVPKAAFCNWRRTIAQRVGRYALVVDDLAFTTDTENMEVQTLWETQGGAWNAGANALRLHARSTDALPRGWLRFRALESEFSSEPGGPDDTALLESIDIVILRAREPGAWLEMTFTVQEQVTGEVFADLLNYTDRGTVRLLLDGEVVVEEFEHYAPAVVSHRVPLGARTLAAGEHRLRVEAIGRREGSDRCFVGLSGVTVQPAGAPGADAATLFEFRPADLVDAVAGGGVTTLEWRGAVREDQERSFFTLIARAPGGEGPGLVCARLGERVAALALPEPAIAFTGDQARLGVVAQDHLFGLEVTAAGAGQTIFSADTPVDVDWDFATGALHVVAAEEATVGAALDPAATLMLDGEALVTVAAAGDPLVRFTVPAGRHVVTGARPAQPALAGLAGGLREALAAATTERERQVAADAARPRPTAPPLDTAFTASAGTSVTDMVVAPSPDGPVTYAAHGKTIHVIGPDGAQVRTLETDGDIRVLHWWDEHRLLLAGCLDEQVIAFNEDGGRQWVFTSVMDDAVFRAAKQYWFKSAHPGIWGLASGVFIEGSSQVFVGSACTLEIINENGELVHRMPVFWGPGHRFKLIDGPDGSINLLIARQPTDGEALAVVNNRTLTQVGRSFHTVPPGHTHVSGWAVMSRNHIYYEDLNGDGDKQVVSEINGFWNRVTVWDREGRAQHSAVFGPGNGIPYRNMRGLLVADFDGDGTMELITATASGLVVALDHECNRLWSRRMDSPPAVLELLPSPEGPPWVVVGCDDGTVLALDGAGELVGMAEVQGTPTRIAPASAADGTPLVMIGTNRGEVAAVGR